MNKNKTLIEQDDDLQNARLESREMFEQVTALRDELEEMAIRQERRVQESRALSADEIEQLRDTALAQREALEELTHDMNRAVQAARAGNADERARFERAMPRNYDNVDLEDFLP